MIYAKAVYSENRQTSKMELFAETVNDFQPPSRLFDKILFTVELPWTREKGWSFVTRMLFEINNLSILFIPMLHFYTLLKHQKTWRFSGRFSGVYRGYGNVALGRNGLIGRFWLLTKKKENKKKKTTIVIKT